MKILHISKFDTGGGAARGAYRLHKSLIQYGYDSNFFVLIKNSSDPRVQAFEPNQFFLYRLLRHIRYKLISRNVYKYTHNRPVGFEAFSDNRSHFGSEIVKNIPECDIVNLHWISGFIDYRSFFNILPDNIPIVWRLPDLNALTGGCHYDLGCGKYNSGCGFCPQLQLRKENDISKQIWKRKKDIFNGINKNRLHIVAQSKWMANEIRNSAILGKFNVSVIPNGLNTNVYIPKNQAESRMKFNIPINSKVILFVASSLNVRRKGFSYLLQAINNINDFEDFLLVTIGGGDVKFETKINHLHLGNVEDDDTLCSIYCSADVFVIPTLQDNFPNTILEAMGCGVPVIGFDVGGVSGIIQNNRTGLLVDQFNIEALCKAIIDLLQNDETRNEMAKNCRQFVEVEYTMDILARRYVELYNSLANFNRRVN